MILALAVWVALGIGIALDSMRWQRSSMLSALTPFALEGRKWMGTEPAYDDFLRPSRGTTFITVGDLKRASRVYDDYRYQRGWLSYAEWRRVTPNI